MLAAINFHDQTGLVTREIRNVAADRHLPAELVASHLCKRSIRQTRRSASVMFRRKAGSVTRARKGVLLHLLLGNPTPSHPSPIEGGGLKLAGNRRYPAIVALPSKRAEIGASGMSAQLSAFMNSSQRR